jgi:hypothetical protein
MRRVPSQFLQSGLRAAVVAAVVGLCLVAAPGASADGTVDVTVAGSGGGSVTSTSVNTFVGSVVVASPGELDCDESGGPVCSAAFDSAPRDSGVVVTLTATPDAGSVFAGWSVSGASLSARCSTPPQSDPTCRVHLDYLNGAPGPPAAVTATFVPTPNVPVAGTDPATGVGATSVTMRGRVNPRGSAVDRCFFEYGTTAAYGAVAPCEPDAGGLGGGVGDVAVSAQTAPLESGMTYHYRLVASNPGGTSTGGDRTFATTGSPVCANASLRAAQGIETVLLPGCMAFEMVSPPKKFSQNAVFPSVSLDGERVLFSTRGALGDAPGLTDLFWGDRYVASRGAAGWTSQSPLPPAQESGNYTKGWDVEVSLARSFAPDFSRWLSFLATSDEFDRQIGTMFRGGLDGTFAALSPRLEPLPGTKVEPSDLTQGGEVQTNFFDGTVLHGASADHERVFFSAGGRAAYLAGDPVPSGGAPAVYPAAGDRNIYVAQKTPAGGPSVALLARDGDGEVWGQRCGARVGGMTLVGPTVNGRNQGAVSLDGSRVLFSTRPGQTDPGAVCDLAANKLRIMRRVDDGGVVSIAPLFGDAGECDRTPACDPTDGDDLFQGASVDGSKVYFTSTRQLADTDTDVGSAGTSCARLSVSAGCDLYLYDAARPVGDRLVQVSAGDGDVYDGIAAVSGDGSHVYFVAQGALTSDPNPQGQTAATGQPNLYSFTYDAAHPDGELAFVGAADTVDAGFLWGAPGTFKGGAAYPVPATSGADGLGGGDGHVLLFESMASLTGDDSDGGYVDVFRYDASADELARVSKAAAGGSDNGSFDVRSRREGDAGQIGTDFAQIGRWVSDDGRSVVFQTSEGLEPSDVSDGIDSYLWRDGRLHRLPGSTFAFDDLGVDTGIAAASGRPALSRDGSVVAFGSPNALLAPDGDLVRDIYVVRANGGFAQQEPVSCDPLMDGCSGPAAGSLPASPVTGTRSDDNAPTSKRGRIALARLSKQRLARLAAGKTVRLGVRVNQAGRIRVTGLARIAGKRRRVLSGSRSATKAGRLGVAVKLTRTGRRAIAGKARLRISLAVTFSAASKPAKATVTLARTKDQPDRGRSARPRRGDRR